MSGLALKGTTWVTVRQYRRTLWLVGAVVALVGVVLGALRIWDAQTADVFMHDGYWVPAEENQGFRALLTAVGSTVVGLLAVPVLTGAFVAGPLVARAYESGTYKLSLTQSVSPAAWLRAKLLTAAAAALLATLALMAVLRIGWSRTASAWGVEWALRGPYEATGIVLLAQLLAAVAVGALLGLLIRRTVLAMAATGIVMGGILLVLGELRWSILPVNTVTGPVGPALSVPENGYVTESALLTAPGTRLDHMVCWSEVARTPGVDTVKGLWAKVEGQCHARHDVTGQYVDYHPQSHFWPTQFIETGILLALAALALFAAFRVLRARHP
ncbi:hypothetical protein GCM10022244_10880 [Streptomyces gulbargensis]|uniref:ABC transporter permease n=1 Tax=Streptomyces gulbargensis TaxID=364901 RepID=A0ABP7LM91_9ACTN